MKYITYILLAIILLPVALKAQTPYDTFAPETSRPMLDADAVYEEIVQENRRTSLPFDTILCAALIDLKSQSLYLVSLADGSLLASAPLTDEVQKWLSVDPLVDKNIATSPYMYCNGNPIIFFDPNGEDEWEFDIKGNLQNHIVNNNVDVLRYLSSNGEIMKTENGMPMERYLPYGSLDVQTADNGHTIVVAHGDHAGQAAFEFLTQFGINTEWTQMKTGTWAGGENFISTSHDDSSENSYHTVMKLFPIYYLREQIHNHPGGNPLPSGLEERTKNGIVQKAGEWGDMYVKKKQQERFDLQVIFKIYIPGSKTYISF